MSSPSPLEEKLLNAPLKLLDSLCERFPAKLRFEARLQVLEGTSSRLGTFSLKDYFRHFRIEPLFTTHEFNKHGAMLLELLHATPIHPALALCALARKPLPHHTRRKAGAYYTDFRLAQFVAEHGARVYSAGRPVIDPACGAGILLCALTLAVCGHDRRKTAQWLANSVYAADLSYDALRGATLGLASLTDDLGAVIDMRGHWYHGDSLLRPETEWLRAAPQGFGLVVANPPWEKIKLSRHEYAKSNGKSRHYGAEHQIDDIKGYYRQRQRVASYAKRIAQNYPIAVSGEADLYIAFMELFLRLARNGGGIAALVPAGLIRSSGTRGLRQELLDRASELEITVLENKARFFSIDTRFKFLTVATKTLPDGEKKSLRNIQLAHAGGDSERVKITNQARLSIRTLKSFRPDLTIPEVRNTKEWRLFARMTRSGVAWSSDDGPWVAEFCRELDMTNDRQHFKARPTPKRIPVIEGRMVHQHRLGAKAYISGTGRRAIWRILCPGESEIVPQFWIDSTSLSDKIEERIQSQRAGFCDITGQTNERSMMAAIIPPGVVCGNKVPTVIFKGDHAGIRLHLWVGMVNSLPFDWLIRRVLTTTVNYFLLRGIPLPNIEPNRLPGREIVQASKDLASLDTIGYTPENAWRMAQLRAKIDLLCLVGYGCGYEDLVLMLEDFPLLDRSQPPLPGERKSTITRDFLLWMAAKRFRRPLAELGKRVQVARELGAVPYVPSQVNLASTYNEQHLVEA